MVKPLARLLLAALITAPLLTPGLAAELGGSTAQMQTAERTQGWQAGRLFARAGPVQGNAGPAGVRQLDFIAPRSPVLFVPSGLPADRPVPLVVLLHGAGSGARAILPLMQVVAEARKFILLAPESEGRTWDLILDRPGPDVERLDRALEAAFRAYPIEPDRIAIAGFSDGASYALSLGLANGSLFTDILAFSPGFMAPPSLSGRPRIFISHGTHDEVLPIERCSRQIVAKLGGANYPLTYREFVGAHVAPPDMVAVALEQFLGRADSGNRRGSD
jgi:phospholipase/carboxylesterase